METNPRHLIRSGLPGVPVHHEPACCRQASGGRAVRWRIENAFLGAGILLLASYAALKLDAAIASRSAVHRFYVEHPIVSGTATNSPEEKVDFTLWSAKRIEAYRKSLSLETAQPVAVLRIPKIQLEAPVYDGTDDLTHNRGLGRILGTARIGQPGNTGIAGHRDGFFRGLKDIGAGDFL